MFSKGVNSLGVSIYVGFVVSWMEIMNVNHFLLSLHSFVISSYLTKLVLSFSQKNWLFLPYYLLFRRWYQFWLRMDSFFLWFTKIYLFYYQFGIIQQFFFLVSFFGLFLFEIWHFAFVSSMSLHTKSSWCIGMINMMDGQT